MSQDRDWSELINSYLALKGLSRQHIESFNYFLNTDIKKILAANNEIRSDFNPNWYLKYTDIYVGSPSHVEDTVPIPMTPQECRIRDLTYQAPIYVDVEYISQIEGQDKLQCQIRK